jgi:hypothetical protein
METHGLALRPPHSGTSDPAQPRPKTIAHDKETSTIKNERTGEESENTADLVLLDGKACQVKLASQPENQILSPPRQKRGSLLRSGDLESDLLLR